MTNSEVFDSRRAAYGLLAAGVAAGLPIPEHILIGDTALSGGRLELYVRDDDTNAVERWASWLGLPAPGMILAPMRSAHSAHPTGWFQPFEARSGVHPATGRQVIVKSYLTVASPADAAGREVAR